MGLFDLLFKPNVEKMEAKKDVDGLIKALRYNKYGIKGAAEALGKIGDKRAIEPLIQALKKGAFPGEVAEALGEIGDVRAVEALINTLIHGYSDVQWKAAEALGKIGDARAVESLIQALGDKTSYQNSYVRWKAAEALGKIGDVRAVGALIQASFYDDDGVKYSAGNALEKIKVLGAVEPFIQALKYDDNHIQEYAAEALGMRKEAGAVEPLIQAMRDKNDNVRWKAAVALGNIGDTRAVEPLIQAMRDKNDNVRWKAAEALGKIGDAKAFEFFIQSLKDISVDVRIRATRAIGEIKDARVVETLIQSLNDRSSSLRWEAAKVLDEIGWNPANDIERAYYLIAKVDWTELVELGKPAVEPLIQALKDHVFNSSDRDFEIAEVLGKIGDKRAAEIIISLVLQDNCYPFNGNLRDSKTMENLFGNYTEYIIKATSFRVEVSGCEFSNSKEYCPDFEGIKTLCKMNTQISNNILHQIVKLRDIKVSTAWSDCSGHTYGTLSFEPFRKMAREELERRGNPIYNPSAYLDDEAWKL